MTISRCWFFSLAVLIGMTVSAAQDMHDLLARQMFGVTPIGRPADMMFTMSQISFAKGKGNINLFVALPSKASAEHPVPVFVFGDHRRGKEYPNIPVKQIVERGYAYVKFNFNDIAPDLRDGWTNGVYSLYPSPETTPAEERWGTIAMWAWGFSRVMDWIETQPQLNAKQVAVVGHSRGGKTALWAGASDKRIALAISNGSGTGGARLLKMEFEGAEPVQKINESFPDWFCGNFKKYNGNVAASPFDADDLIGLMSPRLAYVASATKDAWAGPAGEFEAAKRAGRYWEKAGKKGLAIDKFPAPDTPSLEGNIGYHVRTGIHELTPYDWEQFMNFADRHWK